MKRLTIANQVRINLKTYTMVFTLLAIWILFGFLTNWSFFTPKTCRTCSAR